MTPQLYRESLIQDPGALPKLVPSPTFMAEIVGTVTGALGACDVILRASKGVVQYIADVKTAPDQLKRIATELESLEAITAAVQAYLGSSRVAQLSLDPHAPVVVTLAMCRAYISNFTMEFDKRRDGPRFLFPLSAKTWCGEALDELHRFTNLLHLALGQDGWHKFFEISAQTSKELRSIQQAVALVAKGTLPISSIQSSIAVMEQHLHQVGEQLPVAIAGLGDIKQSIARQEKDRVEAQQRQNKQALLDSICPEDVSLTHLDFSRRRQEGTSTWFSNSLLFSEWMASDETSALVGVGMPGSGKTMIFNAVVDQLTSDTAVPVTVGAVYLSHKNPALHDAISILAALVRNLIEKTEDDLGLGEELSKRKNASSTGLQCGFTASELLQWVRRLSQNGHGLVLCFDALDEIPQASQYQLLRILGELQTSRRIKVFLTTRASVTLDLIPHKKLPIAAQSSDIKAFLEARIDNAYGTCLNAAAGKTSPYPEAASLRKNIIASITKRAGGMFLLANLQISQLEGAVSVREIRDNLARLPRELDEQYETYIEQIKRERHGGLALEALRWLHGSLHPLTSDQLLEALSVRDGDADLDPSGLTAMELILRITIGLTKFDAACNTVSLVHETFQDFLNRRHGDILGNSHSQILTTLATYLTFSAFSAKRPDVPSPAYQLQLGALQQKYKLLKYAYSHWSYHLVAAGEAGMDTGVQIATRISHAPLLRDLSLTLKVLPIHTPTTDGMTVLHVAALWKVVELAKRWVAATVLASATTEEPSTTMISPLHISALVGDVSSVEYFLEQDFSALERDRRGRTPLHFAASEGHLAVVEHLLNFTKPESASSKLLNTPDEDSLTPLHIALVRGHTGVAEFLLNCGAKLDILTSTGQSPLHYAVQFSPVIVSKLLELGASAECVSVNRRTALHWASMDGACELSCLSSIYEAYPLAIEMKDIDGASPLHLLASSIHERLDVAQDLLSHGASSDAKDGQGRTPLHRAIVHRHFELAQYLVLNEGANVDAESEDGTTPIWLAVKAHKCLAKLWDAIATANPQWHLDKHQVPVLHHAVLRQEPSAVEALLSRGVDVNATNPTTGETALQIACRVFRSRRHSSFRLVRSDALSLLLHLGAKVHRVSTSGFSPFHIGLIRGSDVLVGQLLRSVHSSGTQAEVLPSLPGGETAAEYALKHSPRPLFETLCSISPQSFQSVDFVKAVADILTMPRVDETKPQEYAAELGIDLVRKTTSSHIPTCGFSAHHPASCDEFVEYCNKVICWAAEASSAEQRELFITPDRIFGAYYRWLPGENILEFYKRQAANPDDPVPKWECERSLRNMLYALKPTEVAATPPVFPVPINAKKLMDPGIKSVTLPRFPFPKYYREDSLPLSQPTKSAAPAHSSLRSNFRGTSVNPYPTTKSASSLSNARNPLRATHFSAAPVSGNASQKDLHRYEAQRKVLFSHSKPADAP